MSPRRHGRARHEPISPSLQSPERALATIERLLHQPRTAEVLCLLLDQAYRVCAVLVFDGEQTADDVVDAAEAVTHLTHDLAVQAAVLASSRPGHPFTPSDLDRWRHIDALFDGASIELIDWFVMDEHTAVAVCAAAGGAARWPGPDG